MALNRKCPPLARDNMQIVTADNMDSLEVSTFQRTPGTVVDVTCYIPDSYRLQGPSQVTCSSAGEWKPAIPTCVAKQSVTDRADVDDVINDMKSRVNDDPSEAAIIIIVIVTVLVVLFLAFLITYRFYYIKHGWPWEREHEIMPTHQKYSFDSDSMRHSRGSSPPPPSHPPPSSLGYNSVDSLQTRPQVLLRPAMLERRWQGNSSSWGYLTADQLLRDMERSRKTNLWHTWRDFANLSTLGDPRPNNRPPNRPHRDHNQSIV